MSYQRHVVEWTPTLIRRFWADRQAHASEAEWFSYQVGEDLVEYVRCRSGPVQGNILDYGCGRGHLTGQLLNNTAGRVAGCDYSSESVERVNHQYAQDERFDRCVLIEDLPSPIEPDSYDAVFFVETIEHLTDDTLGETLAELSRILAAGGRLIMTTPNDEPLAERTVCCPECGAAFHRMQHVRSFTATSLAALLEGHGFRTVDCRGTNLRGYIRGKSIRGVVSRILFPGIAKKKPHLVYIGKKR